MPKPHAYSAEEIEYALSTVEFYRGDVSKAARFLQIPAQQLRQWRDRPPGEADTGPKLTLPGNRPFPPPEMQDEERSTPLFAPAEDVEEWVRKAFLDPLSPLWNRAHEHLSDAHIAFLWTNVPYKKGGHAVAGTAEIPSCQGNTWTKGRMDWLLLHWFGAMPDFLITLDSVYAAEASDLLWCGRLDHELYHCAQAMDEYDCPKFNPRTGNPSYTIRGHDCEEFAGVVERYGAGAAAGGTAALVRAAQRAPLIAQADIAGMCGTCLR